MNCAEQQKTVGLRATRSKALESRSKLLGFQCCEARGQAPPLKVAGVPVRKRCLISLVQYASSQAKSTGVVLMWAVLHCPFCGLPWLRTSAREPWCMEPFRRQILIALE